MGFFTRIFLYNENEPLIFTRFYFWAFFFIVLLVYSIVYRNKAMRNLFLFIASLFFYYKTSGLFFLLLIFSTITDYFIGHAIYNSQHEKNRKRWLTLSVVINMALLSYFKYTYFFTDTFNQVFHSQLSVVNHIALVSNHFMGTHFDISRIFLPVGISFFTFQTISYSVDVYRHKIKPVDSIIDFGFYVSFFPQLVAGPIVRASEFIPQLYRKFSLNSYEFGYALFIILNGLIKKMLIGDYLAVNFIDRVFTNPLSFSGFENMMALYGYSIQVYCDFSGYTDIAIGVALLLGFQLPINFNSPYKATSVADFWRRWHMSLSSWLKDYLYIPLGGNKKASVVTYICIPIILCSIVLVPGWNWAYAAFLITGIVFWLLYLKNKKNIWAFISMGLLFVLAGIIGTANWPAVIAIVLLIILWLMVIYVPESRKYINTDINLMLTMLLGGLWHGAGTRWVIWGGLNGLGLVVYKLWRKISPYENINTWPVRFWKIFLTFNFITFTRFFFRGDSTQKVSEMMGQIAHHFEWGNAMDVLKGYKMVFLLMAFAYIIHWLPWLWKENIKEFFIKLPTYAKVAVTVVVVFVIYQSVSSELQPFIYFQF